MLLNIGGDAKGQTLFYEKFRIFSALPDIIKAIKRDEFMVRNVEEQILDKKEKGVVLIGYNHSIPFFGYPIIERGKISALKERFGLILFKKYGQRIFQIQLNNTLVPTQDYRKGVYYFIERSLEEDGLFPVGFDILNSPFAALRDEQCYFFRSWPSVSLQDVSEGLIALRPEKEGQVCTWTREFFNKEMYMRYKPLYELMTRKKFNNLHELNSYFERRY